ncbi:MAG: PucR family transcriptional regulator [Candidatus Izemoplasmataceae bacterium]
MAGLTIKELIKHEKLQGVRLVTGKLKEKNEIHNVNIIDNPHSYEWFTAGDFLMTTGYIFKDDIDSQKTLVKELSDLNCSGLGIKIKRYWDEIPKTILDEGKKYNFPIVEIPFTYSLAQVSNIINDEIFQRESSELKKYKYITKTFNQCALDGGDIWEIVDIAKTLITNPVIMLDSSYNLLSYAEHQDNPFPLKDYLPLVVRSKCFPYEFTENIPKDVKAFPISIKEDFVTPHGSITCRIKPIVHSNTIYGYLIIWETIRKMERIDYVAVETASMSLALERIKTRQIEESRNKLRQDFFDDLLHGKIMSINALKSLAQVHGINPNMQHVVMVVKIEDSKSDVVKTVTDLIADTALKHKRIVHSFSRQGNVVCFIELDENENKDLPKTNIRLFMKSLDDALVNKITKNKFLIGVSNVCKEFINIGRSTLIAFDVIKISPMLKTGKRIYYFSDLISYHLIDSTIDTDHLLDFFHNTLGELHEYDYNHNSDLLRTLEMYYECNGNISEASKQLFVHRNTVIYRLDKIKQILASDLNNAEQNFNFQLAIKVYKILQLQHKKGDSA